MIRVALVGCSSSKLPSTAPARHLYTGDLFKRALQYAESEFDQTFVLSAAHGVVHLDYSLNPYDFRIESYTPEELANWAHTCLVQLEQHGIPGNGPVEIHALAGNAYVEPISWQMAEWPKWTLCRPLRGMGIGKQKAFLSTEVA